MRLPLLMLLTVLAACHEGPRAAARPGRDSAGVHIVENPAQDRPLPWSLTEVFRLGGQDSGAATFTEVSRWSAGADTLGHLFVLDQQAGQVEVFDSMGRHLRTLGRKGGGPGEMQFPGLLVVAPDGIATVVDFGKNALVRFAADGTLLPQIALTAGFPNGGILISHDTTVMVVQRFEELRTSSRLEIITPGDTTVLDTLTVVTRGPVMYRCVGLNLPPVLSPRILWASHAGEIAVTGQTRYIIDFFRGDSLFRSVRRSLAAEPATVAHVARLYPEGMKVRFGGGGECVITARELTEKQGVAPYVPLVRDLAIAPDGTLWVERYTFKGDTAKTDVFRADGGYLGTVTGHSLPLGFPGPDLVAFPLEDEDTGASLIVVYRVEGRG